MKLAEKAAAENNEPVRLKLILDWLSEHGLDTDDSADSGTQKFFELFNRHASLVRNLKFKPLAAPSGSPAPGPQLTGLAVSAKLRDRITRGAFAEEVINGRHFELMSRPRVETLAGHLSALLVEPGHPRSPSTVLVR